MKYVIKYRKKGSWFWKKEEIIYHYRDFLIETVYDGRMEEKVISKQISKPVDAMFFVYEDKSYKRIPNWSNYEVILGDDCNEAMKKMELENKEKK